MSNNDEEKRLAEAVKRGIEAEKRANLGIGCIAVLLSFVLLFIVFLVIL